MRGLRLLKVMRLFRIAKLKRLFDRMDQELEGSSGKMLMFAIGKILLLLFSIGHVACCFWYYVAITFEDRYGVSWLTAKMPAYDVDPGLTKSTNYLWSFHYSMATMTTVGYGDISPTNTAEVVYTYALLWTSLVVFSGCMGVLMNLINTMYIENQERRMRMMELSKYMQWRVLPRELRVNIRRYLSFLWDCNEKVGETEAQLMENLSPTLRMSLCVHIFGGVLVKAPFLMWMRKYPGAYKKLAMRTVSLFRENGDMLFSYGEVDSTIYVLVNGWITLSLGSTFEEEHTAMDAPLLGDGASVPEELDEEGGSGEQKPGAGNRRGSASKITVARRMYSSTFDQEADDLAQRAGIAGQDVFEQVLEAFNTPYPEGEERPSKIHTGFTKVASEHDLAYVQAPAFFGENALYSDETPPRQYSAKCLTRAEFCTLQKDDIEQVVQELPYIRDSYDAFKAHMLAQAGFASEEDGSTKVRFADLSPDSSPDRRPDRRTAPPPSPPNGLPGATLDGQQPVRGQIVVGGRPTMTGGRSPPGSPSRRTRTGGRDSEGLNRSIDRAVASAKSPRKKGWADDVAGSEGLTQSNRARASLKTSKVGNADDIY